MWLRCEGVEVTVHGARSYWLDTLTVQLRYPIDHDVVVSLWRMGPGLVSTRCGSAKVQTLVGIELCYTRP